jgi:chromosome segregation ATPase
MQEENSRALQNLQYQLSSLQEELQRQRSTNHSLQLANNQLENSKQTLEMLNRDNQKKLSQYEEKQQQLQKDVHSLLLQKQNLQSLHDTLSINYEKLRENRYNEYQIIHANVMNAVKNEFDNMKLHFNIQPISQENQRTSKSER